MQRGFRSLVALLVVLAACQSDPKKDKAAQEPLQSAQAAAPARVATAWAGQVDSLAATQLPSLDKLPGTLIQARRWTDAGGENLLVMYRTEPAAERKTKYTDEESHVELYARQYVRPPGGQYQELWRLQDAVRNCPFDMWLGPMSGSTQVTDLDQDGQTETTLVYMLTCRSDVSPSQLKLIMHEGKAKYALRGYTVVPVDSLPPARHLPANSCCLDTISKAVLDGPNGYELYPGRYDNEKEFRRAPRAFLTFARAQWRRWAPRDFDQLKAEEQAEP